MRVYVDGLGVWGAGLRDWPHARAVLTRAAEFTAERMPPPSPTVLPPAERRRSPTTARVALQVAAEACGMAGADPATMASVFASSHGDMEITDYLCRELAAGAPLSPTRFHNSVHNAASGYWTIAVGCMHSAIAITAGDHSVGCGLLEATAQVVCSDRRVLLVAYDLAVPLPLSSVCPVALTFGVALVLGPVATAGSLACLALQPAGTASRHASVLPGGLQALAAGNPAARALPLLSLLAGAEAAVVELPPYSWEVTPCR